MDRIKAFVINALVLEFLIGAALPLGCAPGDGVARARVRGEVQVDGQPLEEGTINFFPAGTAEGPSAGGVIALGKYDIPQEIGPVVGENRVEIRGVKKTGRMVPNHMAPGTMREELVEALPVDVNTKSDLVRKIAAGTNDVDFIDLKGQPDPPVKAQDKGGSRKAR
jgi:hypothetical protein